MPLILSIFPKLNDKLNVPNYFKYFFCCKDCTMKNFDFKINLKKENKNDIFIYF